MVSWANTWNKNKPQHVQGKGPKNVPENNVHLSMCFIFVICLMPPNFEALNSQNVSLLNRDPDSRGSASGYM